MKKAVEPEIERKITVDLSKLTEQELKEFDERETPGFNKVKEDCKSKRSFITFSCF